MTSSYLEGNIRLNRMRGRISVHRCALGAKSGIAHFAVGRSDDMDHLADDGNITVPVRRLDDEMEGVGHVALLKVDVEGYEVPVLRGAGQLFARTDAVYVESYEPQLQRYGFTTHALTALLRDHGFAVFRHSNARWLPVPEGYTSSQCENLLAIAAHLSSRVKQIGH